MVRIALRSLRTRWTGLLGAAVALALGVALVAVMGLGIAAAVAVPGGGEQAVTVNALLGTAGGVAAFVSVFVVASTFSYAVAARQRELGLLRLSGATGAQVRTVVVTEAAVVGVVASAAGVLLGRAAAPWLGRALLDGGVAPAGYAIGGQTWPLHLAFWTGVTTALAGAGAAAWRAGRLGPLDALREADAEAGAMTAGRWVWGAGLLLFAVGLTAWRLGTDPGDLLKRKTYTVQPMLLTGACGLLAPVLVRPLVRTLGRLGTGWSGRLVRANAMAAGRRTAAVAAPVLMTVALAGSLPGAAAMIGAAKTAELRAHTSADYVITGDALPDRLADAVRRLPGVTSASSATTELRVPEDGRAVIDTGARAVEPAAFARLARLPVVAGSLTALDDHGIVVNQEWERHTVGDRVTVHLADGTRTTLRVTAVLRTGTGDNGAYVTAHNAPGARTDRIELRTGRPSRPLLRQLRSLAREYGATLATRDAWAAARHPGGGPTRLGFAVVLGIALLYAVISLANTAVMATSARRREVGLLRLAGANRRQVLALFTAESLLAVAAGAVLGTAVAALGLAAMRSALGLLSVDAPTLFPWTATAAPAAICALAAALATALSTPRPATG